jgi:uncharacterized protein YodC (DUF2158 family)
MSAFKLGDVVVHKAGGPKMAVNEIDRELGAVCCDCFVGTKREIAWFPPEVLILADALATITICHLSGKKPKLLDFERGNIRQKALPSVRHHAEAAVPVRGSWRPTNIRQNDERPKTPSFRRG